MKSRTDNSHYLSCSQCGETLLILRRFWVCFCYTFCLFWRMLKWTYVISSVWEIICDAVASLGLENFWFILPRIPYSCQSSTPLPPGNENLVRIWDFEFWVAKNTSPPGHGGDECVETNHCIPQGYRLVVIGTVVLLSLLSSSVHSGRTSNEWVWTLQFWDVLFCSYVMFGERFILCTGPLGAHWLNQASSHSWLIVTINGFAQLQWATQFHLKLWVKQISANMLHRSKYPFKSMDNPA